MEENTMTTGTTMTVREAMAHVDNITACQTVIKDMATLYPEKSDMLGAANSYLKRYKELIETALDSLTVTL